uniref:Putative secreted protein n=1 Tax=Anopheles darlingi TaxID=43151 RepID=A0A2M4DEP9_ANODA
MAMGKLLLLLLLLLPSPSISIPSRKAMRCTALRCLVVFVRVWFLLLVEIRSQKDCEHLLILEGVPCTHGNGIICYLKSEANGNSPN